MTPTVTLAEACTAIVDCEHKTAPISSDGQYFAVGTPAMRGNRINYDEARRISRETFDAWTRRLTPAHGDLLLAREAPVGPVVRIPEDLRVAPGQRTVLLRPNPQVLDPVFAYYLLSSPLQQARLLQKAEGSTVAHLNVADVRRFELPPLPSLEVQRGVASTLAMLDDKIESDNRTIELVGQLLDCLAERCSQTLGTTPLGNLGQAQRKTVNPAALGDELVDHFSLPAFDARVWPERVPASEIKSNKITLPAQSVLISRLNPRFNRTWWAVPADGVRALASTEFMCLSATQGTTLAGLWLALRDEYFRSEIARRVTGTSGSHQRIRPEDLLSIEVPDVRNLRPEEESQARLLLDASHQRRIEARKLANLRDALLPALLSGAIQFNATGNAVEGAVA